MAERLTDKHTVSVYNNSNSEIYLGKNKEATKYIYKLAQLEDIMDKYGIEDLEQYVEEKRKQDKELRDNIQQLHTIINSTGYDRDTWKKACELACEREDDCYVYDNIHRAYEFYQQAKKEGNDERN